MVKKREEIYRAKRGAWQVLALLAVLLVASVILSVGMGAVSISPAQVISILLDKIGLRGWADYTEQQAAVLYAIRLPRALLSLMVGGALAVSGAALQGFFRNPLADPGLLGISSGASVAVAAVIVLSLRIFGAYTLPVVAFAGSTLALLTIYRLAQQDRKTNVATMLLAGIAINALCGAGTGLFTYLSDEDQLRAITFWLLGSFSGATWTAVFSAGPLLLVSIVLMPFLSAALNALLLGESNARHLGVPVESVKIAIIALAALGVGAGVSVSGIIGFVGLVVPHLVRLWKGPNHRVLLRASALLGGTLMVLADLVARTLVAPLELPIGIVTAAIGAPFFLYLLLHDKRTRQL